MLQLYAFGFGGDLMRVEEQVPALPLLYASVVAPAYALASLVLD